MGGGGLKGELLECWMRVQSLIAEGRLSHSAIILYAVLVDLWRSLRRPSSFNVSNKRLLARAGFGSHVSLDKARKQLVEAGLVEARVSKKKYGTEYSIK